MLLSLKKRRRRSREWRPVENCVTFEDHESAEERHVKTVWNFTIMGMETCWNVQHLSILKMLKFSDNLDCELDLKSFNIWASRYYHGAVSDSRRNRAGGLVCSQFGSGVAEGQEHFDGQAAPVSTTSLKVCCWHGSSHRLLAAHQDAGDCLSLMATWFTLQNVW